VPLITSGGLGLGLNCYFGLGLDVKNLVLFTSLAMLGCATTRWLIGQPASQDGYIVQRDRPTVCEEDRSLGETRYFGVYRCRKFPSTRYVSK